MIQQVVEVMKMQIEGLAPDIGVRGNVLDAQCIETFLLKQRNK